MDYKELQKKASDLGIKAVGVKKDELEKLVAEAEATKNDSPETPEVEETPTEEKTNYNTALVYNGARVVRKFSSEMHGEEFEDLAKEYAGHKGFRVEMVEEVPRTECPSCGHKFNPPTVVA